MAWRRSKVDSQSSSRIPLGDAPIRLQSVVQGIDRAAKGMIGLETRANGRAGEPFQGTGAVVLVRKRGHEMIGCTNSIRPEVELNSRGPPRLGMQQHLAGSLLQISDPLLCDTILEVSVDATVRYGLASLGNIVNECIVGESSIVAMVMLDLDVMRTGIGFEGSFGSQSLVGSQSSLEIDVAESGIMIYEDRRCAVSLLRKASLQLGDESGRIGL